jgi:peroxiredoxin Q/BCP
MAQLRQDFDEFEQRDTAVVVVGPEGPAAFAKYWSENHLPFVGLPDPRHSVLKLYGQQIKIFKYGRMPAQVLVDKSGAARFVHYGHDMTDIPKTSDMLALIDGLNEEETTAEGSPGTTG